jgi:hypothetical protein
MCKNIYLVFLFLWKRSLGQSHEGAKGETNQNVHKNTLISSINRS